MKKSLKDIKKLNRKLKKELNNVAKKGIVAEFRDFISKGNVMNLAVGVIIGGAFQSIVNSVVNDILMPIISVFTKGIDFSEWFITLDGEIYDNLAQAKDAGVAIISYGNFLSATLNFLIMAFIIFLLVKLLNKLTSPLSHIDDEETKAETEAEAEKEEEIPPRICPYCKMEIPNEALRCPHCTSDVRENATHTD